MTHCCVYTPYYHSFSNYKLQHIYYQINLDKACVCDGFFMIWPWYVKDICEHVGQWTYDIQKKHDIKLSIIDLDNGSLWILLQNIWNI
jgi:hypothetical protein